jgi:hypothetical protein
MHLFLGFVLEIFKLDWPLSLTLFLGLVAILLLLLLECCVFLRSHLDYLRFCPSRADNFSFHHPRVIAATPPAVMGWAFAHGAVLVISEGFLRLAGIGAGLA